MESVGGDMVRKSRGRRSLSAEGREKERRMGILMGEYVEGEFEGGKAVNTHFGGD